MHLIAKINANRKKGFFYNYSSYFQRAQEYIFPGLLMRLDELLWTSWLCRVCL